MNDLLFYILVGILALFGIFAAVNKRDEKMRKWQYICIITIALCIVALVVIEVGVLGVIF
jgi:uncharacterized membrane protein